MLRNHHNVWAFSPGADLVGATEVALDQLRAPDLGISILRDYGDEIRVAVDWGGVADPAAVFYVQRRGMYRLAGSGRAAPVRHAPGRQTLSSSPGRTGDR